MLRRLASCCSRGAYIDLDWSAGVAHGFMHAQNYASKWLDVTRALRAARRLPRLGGRALVQTYRYTLRAVIGAHCRHLPSCSEYADEALARHGLWAGSWITVARICRCHPLGTSGLDFVPPALPARGRWWLPWRYGRWRGTQSEPPPIIQI